MTAPERVNERLVIQTAFERQIGRPATVEEADGIRRAYQRRDTVTAKLALGVIMGVNEDWPLWHCRSALDAYGLIEFLGEPS